jgi:hypothetical protein
MYCQSPPQAEREAHMAKILEGLERVIDGEKVDNKQLGK